MITIQKIAERQGMQRAEVESVVNFARNAIVPNGKVVTVTEGGEHSQFTVLRQGVGLIITEWGEFWMYDFYIDEDRWKDYVVVVKAELDDNLLPVFTDKEQLLLRTDSGCETGQTFHDLTCECREQLHYAMQEINSHGEGMIIHIPKQDGRGMGLHFKLSTLTLQARLGLDTVESATLMANDGVIDIRTYAGVIGILKYFQIPETCGISLATNNPKKAHVFKENGYKLNCMKSVIIQPNHHTEHHLRAKQTYLGHIGLVRESEVQS